MRTSPSTDSSWVPPPMTSSIWSMTWENSDCIFFPQIESTNLWHCLLVCIEHSDVLEVAINRRNLWQRISFVSTEYDFQSFHKKLTFRYPTITWTGSIWTAFPPASSICSSDAWKVKLRKDQESLFLNDLHSRDCNECFLNACKWFTYCLGLAVQRSLTNIIQCSLNKTTLIQNNFLSVLCSLGVGNYWIVLNYTKAALILAV